MNSPEFDDIDLRRRLQELRVADATNAPRFAAVLRGNRDGRPGEFAPLILRGRGLLGSVAITAAVVMAAAIWLRPDPVIPVSAPLAGVEVPEIPSSEDSWLTPSDELLAAALEVQQTSDVASLSAEITALLRTP